MKKISKNNGVDAKIMIGFLPHQFSRFISSIFPV